MRILRLAASVVILAYCAHAQVITTYAGSDFAFPATPIAATSAPTGPIASVAVDPAGNVYFAESDIGNNIVSKVDRQGTLTVVAGNGVLGFSGDGGPATSASLYSPVGVAVDAFGDVFFADTVNNRVRFVTPQGIVYSFVGNGTAGYSGDGGLGINARLNLSGNGMLAVDLAGNLYIADQGNNVIRKVTPVGMITTVAGNGVAGFSGDGGLAVNASLNLNGYGAVAVDASGNLFIADRNNNRIRKVTPGGIISTVAGSANWGFSGDGGSALSATLNFPNGVAVDSAGNLFISDSDNGRIRKVTPDGIIHTIAGTGAVDYSGDGGPAINATFGLLTGVAVDAFGNLFVADGVNDRVRKINPAGIISTIAGNGRFRYGGDGGPAAIASLNYPSQLAVDTSGDLYITDPFNARVRKVTAGGIISTVAGNGTGSFSGDGGLATNAGFLFPCGVAVDSSGNLFIADSVNARIRKVTPDGIVRTVAGNGIAGYFGDGASATDASLDLPTAVAVDASGNLFVADNKNHRIRKVTPGGIISTVAGNGTPGYSGDNGPAISAELNLPTGIALDAAGSLYIVDSGNDRIRKVSPSGTISTIAGNGTVGHSGDGGPAIGAALRLNSLAVYDGIAVDASGNVFFADFGNNVVRRVTPGGTITTVAGDGFYGSFGDGGLAINAKLAEPSSVALNKAGDLFIADVYNTRVRVVLAAAPAVSVSPQQLTFSAASNGAPTPPQNLSFASPVPGLSFNVTVSNGGTWLQVSPASGASPRLVQVTADPAGLAPNTYQGIITIHTPDANPTTSAITVTFNVTAAVPPALSIDKPSLSFPFPLHGSALSQTLTVSNTGGGTLQFTATASTVSGGSWLLVSPGSAQALPGAPAALTITANPSGLSPGVFSGQVTISWTGQTQTIPVTMTISALDKAILLSQSGLSFLAVNGGGVIPTQSFGVQNIGTGVVNWTATTSTLSGGPNWLQVSPASGSSDAAAPTSPRVTVSVDGSSLPAGTYYGLVRVDAPGAANSPQVVTIFLQVLPANTNVAGVVQPAQLVFTATAGFESPGSQMLQIYNIAAGAKSYRSLAQSTFNVFVSPQNATLDPERPTRMVVQPFTANLPAGVYTGVLTFQFSDGNISTVKLTVIVSNLGQSTSSIRSKNGPNPADSGTPCTPTKLLPALTTLGPTFSVSAGWPTALIVDVKDDCGAPMPPSGSVTVDFSDGEPSLSLQGQGDGSWESTWTTSSRSSTGVTLKIHAAHQGMTGDAEVNGSLGSQQEPPVFTKAGITSSAVIAGFVPLAPGAVISIYGSRLAESTLQAQTLPLPNQLVSTQVFVAGTGSNGASTGLINLPLYYVSENQVNAIVPYNVSVNTTLQLLVQRGSTYSVPVQIDMAQAQPAMFSNGGLAGSPGLLYVFPANGAPAYLGGPNAPAHVGDTIVLYAAGLGAVDHPVDAGAAPGQDLSSTVIKPVVTVGGQQADVPFAGLAPGFAGLYQVNVVVPQGTQAGTKVPVTMTIDGQSSAPITVAIQ